MPQCSVEDFVRLVETIGVRPTARRLGLSQSAVHRRRRRLEEMLGRQIVSGLRKEVRSGHATRVGAAHPKWLTDEIETGIVLVGSDAHYWPAKLTPVTTAHKGFVKFCKDLKPRIVVMNGDVLDGAKVSRHAPIGWEDRPELIHEIEAAQERLGEIEQACKARRIWTLGNHDGRFETRLATVAPEYMKVHGVHLKDHFGAWEPCWSLCINDSVVIKHRYRGGIHATWNNVVNSGRTIVTGHLHSLQVRPFSDYNGTRWGVDTGTLAEPYGPQFEDYTESNPLNWRSGFVVLTFHKGRLLQPQTAMVIEDGKIDYCGKVIEV